MRVSELRIRVFGYIAALFLVAGVFASLGYVPPIHDAEGNYLGESFRIFFFHVPAAWTSFLCFGAACAFALVWLACRDERYDRLSAACAEVGWVFATIVILTGPIWARAAWGIFWSWEPRLVTFAVLWLLYLGYLLMRYSIEDRAKRSLFSSVLAVIAFLEVPIVMFAIHLWGTKSHPKPGGGFFEDPVLRNTAFFNVFAFMITAAYFIAKRLLVSHEENHD